MIYKKDSRSITDLNPEFKIKVERFLNKLDKENIKYVVYFTTRSLETQAYLWRAGRTKSLINKTIASLRKNKRVWVATLIENARPNPEPKILTNALPGGSSHNYGYGLDIVPIDSNKLPLWDYRKNKGIYKRMAAIGKTCGLAWGGSWVIFKGDYCHFEEPKWKKLIG